MNISELENVVYDLNQQFYDQTQDDGDISYPLSVRATGIETAVTFLGKCIWSTECDERETVIIDGKEAGFQEPVRDYLIREINKWMKKFGKIELK